MARRIYIHAGLHKTGTSSIQVELTRARHLLRGRGVLYPRTGLPESAPYGHHLLPWSLVRDQALVPPVNGLRSSAIDRGEIWRILRAEIEDANLPEVIISSEEFDILDREAIDAISRELSDYDIVPIIFLRNISDLVESSYRTAVMVSGFTEDVSFFIGSHRTRTDYAALLTDWMSVSPSGRVIAASYDDSHLSDDSVITFLRLIGLAADAIEPVRLSRQNESSPAFVVEITRFLRSMASTTEADVSAWLEAVRRVPFTRDAYTGYTLLPEHLRGQLDSLYLQELSAISSNHALASQIYGQLILPLRDSNVTCIHNVKDAILAYTRELERIAGRG